VVVGMAFRSPVPSVLAFGSSWDVLEYVVMDLKPVHFVQVQQSSLASSHRRSVRGLVASLRNHVFYLAFARY
jgi:hypothetical protein